MLKTAISAFELTAIVSTYIILMIVLEISGRTLGQLSVINEKRLISIFIKNN